MHAQMHARGRQAGLGLMLNLRSIQRQWDNHTQAVVAVLQAGSNLCVPFHPRASLVVEIFGKTTL